MESPRYTVTVESLTRGWSYTTTEGDAADFADDVHLISPLSYSGGFKSDQIPGQLEPCQAVVNFAARTADDSPAVVQGDMVKFSVRVGTDGPFIVDPPAMRVTEAVLDLDPHREYAARLNIGLVDVLSTLPTLTPYNPAGGEFYGGEWWWRERFAEIAYTIGRTIGAPDWWPDGEHIAVPVGAGDPSVGLRLDAPAYGDDAGEELEKLINSHQVSGYTHVLTPNYRDTHPTGFEKIGPSTWRFHDGTTRTAPFTEPTTTERFYYVVGSRRTDASGGLPLVLAVEDGVLTIVPGTPTPGGNARLGVFAAWCQIPAAVRRAREHITTVARLAGQGALQREDEPGFANQDEAREFGSALETEYGRIIREIPTALFLGSTPGGALDPWPEPPLVAASFISDDSVGTWAFDEFRIRSSLIPDAHVENVLPKIAPRFPGETDGDHSVVRHVVIYGLDGSASVGGAAVAGFVAHWSMSIGRSAGAPRGVVSGDIEWTLSLTPGEPQWDVDPTPVTFDEFETAAAGLTFGHVDPRIRLADLAYVDA